MFLGTWSIGFAAAIESIITCSSDSPDKEISKVFKRVDSAIHRIFGPQPVSDWSRRSDFSWEQLSAGLRMTRHESNNEAPAEASIMASDQV